MSWRDISVINSEHLEIIANYLCQLKCSKLNNSKTTFESNEFFASWEDYENFKYLIERSKDFYNLVFNMEEIEVRDEHYSLWCNKLIITFEDDKKIVLNCEGKFTTAERQTLVLNYAEAENKRLKEEIEKLKLELSKYKGN